MKQLNCNSFSFSSIRQLSNLPETTVYGGPSPQLPAKRVTLRHLSSKFVKKEPITMVTAYDYPSAVHVDMVALSLFVF